MVWHVSELVSNKLKEAKIYRPATGNLSTFSKADSGTRKEPDGSYIPKTWNLPEGRSRKFPSIAIEIGWSETAALLEWKAKFWLNEPKGDVKLVITVDIKKSGNIVVSTWEGGPITGRFNGGQPPKLRQRLRITKYKEGTVCIIGDDIEIPLESILLRKPQGIPKNMILSKNDWKDLAEDFWVQNFP